MVMIKESDQVFADLPGLMPHPELHVTRQNGERLYVDEFKHAYEYFLEAKDIATTEREISGDYAQEVRAFCEAKPLR
jgi:hypothetical protein